MMPAALIDELAARGVTLSVEADRLAVEGPDSAWTPALLAELRAHKAELLALLRQGEAAPPARPPRLTPYGLPVLDWRCATGCRHAGPTRSWSLAADPEPRLWVCAVCHPPAPGLRIEWKS